MHMKQCSEETCKEFAIKEIEIKGVRTVSGKHENAYIYVCNEHYSMEKEAGSIITESDLDE